MEPNDSLITSIKYAIDARQLKYERHFSLQSRNGPVTVREYVLSPEIHKSIPEDQYLLVWIPITRSLEHDFSEKNILLTTFSRDIGGDHNLVRCPEIEKERQSLESQLRERVGQ